jgi:alkylation response protein AidB-like acyl-CoA dehydrogenase
MGEEGKGFLYYAAFCFRAFDYGYKCSCRAEYAIEYTIEYMSKERLWKTIDKFQALRHTIVEHATDVEHCKVFNYAAVAD